MNQANTNSTHKIKATNDQVNEMLAYYRGYLTYNTSNYTIARAKLANATITFYRTNVVLFQGGDEQTEYNYWASRFAFPKDELLVTMHPDYSNLSAIGSDEVGTGDYFGPVVVCAAYVSAENIAKLRQLGIKDSKLMTDNQMIPLALKLSQMIPYSIVLLEPAKLNTLSKKLDNLNFVKAYLHNKAINSILKKLADVKYDAILIDEFTPKEKYFEYLKNQPDVCQNVVMIQKGERAHIAIAAASVLARVAFLREMNRLSKEYGIELLKGAGKEVDRTAISFVKSYSWMELSKVAKLKFMNTTRVKAYFEENPLPKSKQIGIEMID